MLITNATSMKAGTTRAEKKSDDKKQELFEYVKTLPFAEVYGKIFDSMSSRDFSAGETVYEDGMKDVNFYVIAEGTCKLDGKEVRVANEQALLGSEADVKGTLVAETECVLWFIDRLRYQSVFVAAMQAQER